MIENKPEQQLGLPEIYLPKEVVFYTHRMTDLITLRDHLEGDYPLESYEGITRNQLNMMIRKGIFGSQRMLHALGYGEVADSIIRIDRMQHEL